MLNGIKHLICVLLTFFFLKFAEKVCHTKLYLEKRYKSSGFYTFFSFTEEKKAQNLYADSFYKRKSVI